MRSDKGKINKNTIFFVVGLSSEDLVKLAKVQISKGLSSSPCVLVSDKFGYGEVITSLVVDYVQDFTFVYQLLFELLLKLCFSVN